MRRTIPFLAIVVASACARRAAGPVEPPPKGFGAAIVVVSGEKQTARVGAPLDQPVVVQVNDAKGAAVPDALVRFAGASGVVFFPDHGLTGLDGQFSTGVTVGSLPGRYEIVADIADRAGEHATARIPEIALGYRERLGQQLDAIYCARCHDPESTPERVSNYENLNAKPHAFTEGAVLNAMSDADLASIIGRGGAALHKSAESPPYANRLTKAEIDALIAYIRAVADPPYPPRKGIFYARN